MLKSSIPQHFGMIREVLDVDKLLIFSIKNKSSDQ